MLNLLVLLSLLGVPPDLKSMEFDRLQVEWIASTRIVKNLEDVLPRRQAMLIRALGCEHGDCRVLARDELLNLGHTAFEALVWGTRMRDIEISTTSQLLLDRLYVCKWCNGSGLDADSEHEDIDVSIWYLSRCRACLGSGDMRFRILNAKDGKRVPVDAFRR